MQPQAQLKCPAVPRHPNTLWMICSNGKFRNADRQWLYTLTVMDLHTGYVRGHPQVLGPATRAKLVKVFQKPRGPETV